MHQCCSGPWIFRRYATPGLPRVKLLSRQARQDAALLDISLHWNIRDRFCQVNNPEVKKRALEIRKLEHHFKKLKKDWEKAVSKEAKLRCLPHESKVIKYRNLVKEAERIVLDSSDIVICTCSQATSDRFWSSEARQPSQCLVDEAGQSTEPETFAAIAQAKEKVVLLGDHKQLQPVVSDGKVKEILSKSLFERLSKFSCALKVQYRMVRQ